MDDLDFNYCFGMIMGFVLGCFTVFIIFSVNTEYWLSPKMVRGEVYYYGADYGEKLDEYYWWYRGKKCIIVENDRVIDLE